MGRLAIPIRYAIGRVAPRSLSDGREASGATPFPFGIILYSRCCGISLLVSSVTMCNVSLALVDSRLLGRPQLLSIFIRDRRITMDELTGSERAPTLSTPQPSQR